MGLSKDTQEAIEALESFKQEYTAQVLQMFHYIWMLETTVDIYEKQLKIYDVPPINWRMMRPSWMQAKE